MGNTTELLTTLKQMATWNDFKPHERRPRHLLSSGISNIMSAITGRKQLMASLSEGGQYHDIAELYQAMLDIPLPILAEGGVTPLTLETATEKLESDFLVWLVQVIAVQESAKAVGKQLGTEIDMFPGLPSVD